MGSFAGNVLALKTLVGDPLICMSTQAYESLQEQQIKRLKKHGKLIYNQLYSIERYGGGGARCMMAELF